MSVWVFELNIELYKFTKNVPMQTRENDGKNQVKNV